MHQYRNKPRSTWAQLSLLAGLLSGPALAETQIFYLSDYQRIEATIALDAMNRLMVSQDRISNVFGDEGTFVSQTDEPSGQVFIKPTPENGDKPLVLTLMTEKGHSQDLTLIPTASEPSTVILKAGKTHSASLETALPDLGRRSNDSEPWLQALKQAVLGALPETTQKERPPKRKREGFALHYQRSLEAGPVRVQVWILKNKTAVEQVCLEQDFYQPGDRALVVERRYLAPGGQSLLYRVGEL